MAKRVSGTVKLVNALYDGKTVTKAYAKNRFGLKNLRARICELRNEGYRIDGETIFARNGRQTFGYTLNQ